MRRNSGINRAVWGVAALLGVSAFPTSAFARGRALEAVMIGSGSEKVRIDGLLREWPARLDSLGDVLKGSGAGDPSATGAIGYDDKNLYVAMKVHDKKLVRTPNFGDGEDFGSLEIAFPTRQGFKPYSVRLYAGEIGRSAGAVRIDGSNVHGARLVEAPSDGGYTFEASIPWGAFPESSSVKVGLRAALRYSDSDTEGSVHTVIGTSGGSGSSLPPLLLEAEQGLYRSLVRAKGLPETPTRFAVGDIAGDGTLEAVSVYGTYLTVVGSAYRGGKQYFFEDLAVGDAGNATHLDVTDLTGDGKDEIVVQKRVSGKHDTFRDVVQILHVAMGDTPSVAFTHETGVETKAGEILNDVSIKRQSGKVDLVIAQGKASGFEPATYSEPMPDDMDSALLPWQPAKTEVFEWNGKEFASAGGETWTPKLVPPTPHVSRAVTQEEAQPLPPPPRPPSPDELLERVYALYRADHHVGIARPRFDFVTDVAGDVTPERVLIHGKDIVVFGKAFKEGMSYAYITIGVENAKDVLDVTAKDLTGDGKAEIVVRGVLHAKASKQLGGKMVDRQALYVYQTSEGGLKRIFAAETGRALGKDAIVGDVKFIPKGRNTAVELAAGRAVGWTDQTYPFPVDKLPYGGLEPLLVPWGEVTSKRYRYDGSAFVAEP
jgi:hypothetical protein